MQLKSWMIGVAASALGAAAGMAQELSILELKPGSQHVITLPQTFDSVTVGNPETVDVLPKSDRVMVVVGKKVGQVDIIAFSAAKPTFKITAIVGETRAVSRVYSHGKSNVNEYWAYECNPICVRVKDDYEGRTPPQPIVIEGGATVSASQSGPTTTRGIISVSPP